MSFALRTYAAVLTGLAGFALIFAGMIIPPLVLHPDQLGVDGVLVMIVGALIWLFD